MLQVAVLLLIFLLINGDHLNFADVIPAKGIRRFFTQRNAEILTALAALVAGTAYTVQSQKTMGGQRRQIEQLSEEQIREMQRRQIESKILQGDLKSQEDKSTYMRVANLEKELEFMHANEKLRAELRRIRTTSATRE